MNIRTTTATVLLAATITTAAATTANATDIPTAQPVASPMEDHRAMEAFTTQLGVATSLGGFAGTIPGAAVGCLIGAGVIAVPTAFMATPIGCAAGAVTGAAAGGIIGTIAVGGPALAITGADLVSTLTAAPGTTKWASNN